MKILHIVPAYLPAYRYGGPIKSDHYRNKWLVKKGCDVTVFTTNIDGPDNLAVPLGERVDIDGVKVFYFLSTFPRSWFYSLDLHFSLAKLVQNFDLVHITSVFLAESTLGAHYAKKSGKPYIISPRGSLMKEPLVMKSRYKKKIYIDLIEKRNLADAAAIHFTAQAEKDEYLEAGLPLRDSFVVPNGLDEGEFKNRPPAGYFRQKFNFSPDKKIVLFLSRLNWKKGLDTLIPSFKRVVQQEPKAVLVLAGGDDEGYKKQIEILVRRHNLTDKVVFTDMLLDADKIAAFQDAQLFVLPSYSENFGMAVLEAMYFGLPVVVTKYVGIASSIAGAEAGLVIEKDENDLAAAILEILHDPDLAGKFGKNGKLLVEKEFSMSSVADKFIGVYTEIIKR